MHASVAREVRLTRPGAETITPTAFQVVESSLPAPGEGDVVVDVSYASLDPYQRIRMRLLPSGGVPPAGVVGRVVASRSEDVAVGDVVTAEGAWATRVVVPAASVTKVEPHQGLEEHHAVGVLGLTGLTGYLGITRVTRPEPGQKLVVSGAYGGVGQVACQVAVAQGADVLGLVGGDDKVAALERLGVAALDRRAPDWLAALEEWAPSGVDLFFDTVWGDASARVVEHLRPFGRVTVAGQSAGLTGPAVPPLPIADWFVLLTRSLTVQAFRAGDYAAEFPEARRAVADLVRTGRLQQEIQVVDGWDNAGAAYCDLLSGRTSGKLVVQVAA